MSADGNLIAYSGDCVLTIKGCGDTIDLYNVSTGVTTSLFPANARNGDELGKPVLSGDGTHMALEYASATNTSTYYLVIKALDGSAVTNSDAVDEFDDPFTGDTPVELNENGSTLVYMIGDHYTVDTHFEVYKNGSTYTVPRLSDKPAVSADVTPDGSDIFYTLALPSSDDPLASDYPGVYEWQIP